MADVPDGGVWQYDPIVRGKRKNGDSFFAGANRLRHHGLAAQKKAGKAPWATVG